MSVDRIPLNWNLVRCGDVIDVRDGTHYTPKYVPEGIPFITSKHLSADGIDFGSAPRISVADHREFSRRSLVERGDILFGMIGTIGNPVLVETQAEFSIKNVALFKFANSKVDARYFLHLLKTDFIKKQLDRNSRGGNQKFISLIILRDLRIPLPTLEEQRRIADALDLADALRQKRRLALQKLDTLVRSVFLEMFGDPVTNSKGWEVKRMKDISTRIQSGNTPMGGKQVYKPEGITFFRSQNVWRNRLASDDIAYIDEATHRKMAKSSLKNKDILITKTGRFNTENSSLGRAAIFLGQNDSANINGHVYLVRLKGKAIHEFVLFVLTTNEYREYIRRVCVGGIDKRQVNKEHLEEFPIISPPVDLQRRFAGIIEASERQKTQFRAHLAKLEMLFDSLQNRAFRGELNA